MAKPSGRDIQKVAFNRENLHGFAGGFPENHLWEWIKTIDKLRGTARCWPWEILPTEPHSIYLQSLVTLVISALHPTKKITGYPEKSLRTIAEWWKMGLLPKLSVFSFPFQLRATHFGSGERDLMIQNARSFSQKISSATSCYQEQSHVISKSTGSCISYTSHPSCYGGLKFHYQLLVTKCG